MKNQGHVNYNNDGLHWTVITGYFEVFKLLYNEKLIDNYFLKKVIIMNRLEFIKYILDKQSGYRIRDIKRLVIEHLISKDYVFNKIDISHARRRNPEIYKFLITPTRKSSRINT